MSDAEFKLPSSSYEEVMKIVQAYALINKPASLDDVSKRIGTNPTTVSSNNGFLISIGVIGGSKSKSVTPLGKQLGDALSHGIDDEVRRLLRAIVDEAEFLKNVLGAIRIRRGMEEGALKAHIAYSAGVSKSASVMTGAGAIIELMKHSGAIEEEDGKLVVASGSTTSPQTAISDSQAPQVVPLQDRLVLTPAGSAGSIALSIEVHVSSTVAELDGLGEKLRAIVSAFNSNADD